jgi:phosphate transport system protein
MAHETRHHMREQLIALEESTLEGLDLVEEALECATEALDNGDMRLAEMVVADDDRIDGRYLEVHQGVLSLLAREAPVATDLRVAAALLHVSRHIERMGDQCVNICKLIPLIGHDPPVRAEVISRIDEMSRLARIQTLDAKRAFATRDVELAEQLARSDLEINRLNREIFHLTLQMGGDFDTREWATVMMLVARCIERIGDNAVDIGEHVVFVVTGLFREFSDASHAAGA